MKKACHITTLLNNTRDWEKPNITTIEIALHQPVDSESEKVQDLYKELTDSYFMTQITDLNLHPSSLWRINAFTIVKDIFFFSY